MSEKARGAIFNALGDIDGLTVLDAFSGSGALALEAISRGASRALLIDNDKNAQKAISRNISELRLGSRVKLISASANAWCETSTDVFDLVLLDPPYDNIQAELLERLASRAKSGGIVVVSLPPDSRIEFSRDNYEMLASKNYGDATLEFYRKISG